MISNRSNITGAPQNHITYINRKRAFQAVSLGKYMLGVNMHVFIFSAASMKKSRLRASLTIEAAFILPIFMFFSVFLMSFLLIFSLQTDIQRSIDSAARDVGKRAYIADGTMLSQLSSNPLVIKAEILSDTLPERLNNSRVVGGEGGLNTFMSTYSEDSGILDVIVTYQYSLPFFSGILPPVHFMQRMKCRAWIGRELDPEKADSAEDDDPIVFVTPSGTAYHLTKACPYLDLSIKPVMSTVVPSMRNASGAIYYRCPSCTSETTSGTVYVTEYGTSWHASLSCSSLKRTVLEIRLSQIDGRHACPKCGG